MVKKGAMRMRMSGKWRMSCVASSAVADEGGSGVVPGWVWTLLAISGDSDGGIATRLRE